MLRCSATTLLALLSLTSVAIAQEDPSAPADDSAEALDAPAEPAAEDPATGVDPAAPAEASTTGEVQTDPAASSGSGLRNGFSASVGYQSGAEGSVDYSGMLFGADWRIGWKFTPAISAYLDSHLSFGSLSTDAGNGSVIGNFAFAVMGEYELPMRLFLAGGGGYGIVNNPNGPLAQFRVGYYPFKNDSAGKSRRLNVALDARFYMLDAPRSTFSHFAISIGYDRF